MSTLPLSTQPPVPAPQKTTFKSAATLVQVTAIVRDGRGSAIGTLAADDFILFDDSRRQTISHFAVEELGNQPAWRRGGRVPQPGNQSRAAAVPNHFVAFVVDDQNLVPEDVPPATQAAIRRVSELSAADRAAVYATSGRALLDFTGDRDRLRQVLGSIGSLDRRATFDVSRLNSEITCQVTYLKADWILKGDAASMRNCIPAPWSTLPPSIDRARPALGIPSAGSPESHRIALENQVRTFAESVLQAGDRDVRTYFAALAKLIDEMSRMPGERSIFLLSPGMYIAQRFRSLQDETIAAAVRARVRISGVDPRGVYLRNNPEDPSTWTDTWGLAETNNRTAFMQNITSGTGGAFIKGDNDIGGSLRRLDAMPEFVYVLGFSPAPSTLDGRYHALRVVLKHRQGLTVESRRGYYAGSTEAENGDEAQLQVRDIFFSSRDMHDLPVKLTFRSSQKPNERAVLTAIAQVDLAKVPFRKEDGVNRDVLDFVVGLFDPNGKYIKDIQKRADLHPTDRELAALRVSGIEVRTDFQVDPGQYLVKVLVRENQGRAIGVETAGVDIEPWAQ